MFRLRIEALLIAMLGCAGCGAEVTAPKETCELSAAAGVRVTNRDIYGMAPYALGYPPHAADGCSLLYVAPPVDETNGGELRLRNLTTGQESIIADAYSSPRRPVMAGDWMAWEAESNGRGLIHVRNRNESTTIVVDGPFDRAAEPRIATNGVVFTAWLSPEATADADIALYDPTTGKLEFIATGPGQQRFADISTTHIAWADFSEDPDGRFDNDSFDIADIVVFDRQSGNASPRPREGKQAFPMLGATGKLAFLDWNLVHPEPKLVAYDLRIADIEAPLTDSVLVESIQTSAPYVRPVARGKFLEWVAIVDMLDPRTALWRSSTDTMGDPTLVHGPSAVNRFAPTASDEMTFIGVQNVDGSVELEAFER
jgi:hypothetical protein